MRKVPAHPAAPARPPRKSRSPLMRASGALLALGLMFLALFWRDWYAYRANRTYYRALSQSMTGQGEAGALAFVDFDGLLAQNPDTVAWLEIPGIGLSLPVVQGDDNDRYLRIGFDGEPAAGGCLFLAAENPGDFTGVYSIIYGHNLHDGSMFGRLQSYADPAFLAANPTFSLYTPDGSYTCRVFSCHEARDGDAVYTAGWAEGEAFDAFAAGLCALSDRDTGVKPTPGSRVLTLSTCASSYGGGDRRYVVHALLEKQPEP